MSSFYWEFRLRDFAEQYKLDPTFPASARQRTVVHAFVYRRIEVVHHCHWCNSRDEADMLLIFETRASGGKQVCHQSPAYFRSSRCVSHSEQTQFLRSRLKDISLGVLKVLQPQGLKTEDLLGRHLQREPERTLSDVERKRRKKRITRTTLAELQSSTRCPWDLKFTFMSHVQINRSMWPDG